MKKILMLFAFMCTIGMVVDFSPGPEPEKTESMLSFDQDVPMNVAMESAKVSSFGITSSFAITAQETRFSEISLFDNLPIEKSTLQLIYEVAQPSALSKPTTHTSLKDRHIDPGNQA